MPRTRPSKQPKEPRRSAASRLRGVADELGVTMPKKLRRGSAGLRQAPRARPRKIR